MSQLILLILFVTPTVMAHDSDEVLTLKAANDALTVRVAELLAENKRLEEFAKKAMVAKASNKRVSIGCDPQELRELLVLGDGYNSSAESWLKENHQDCTKENLDEINNKLGGWSSYDMRDARRLVRFYRDQK